MAGETDLSKLLATMTPELRPGIHVFATLPRDAPVSDSLEPVMLFREREGTTVIALEEEAEAAGLEIVFRCRMVTLNVHSSPRRHHHASCRRRHGCKSGLGLLS